MTDVREHTGRARPVRSPPRAYRGERVVIPGGAAGWRRTPAKGLSPIARTIEAAIIPSLVMGRAKPHTGAPRAPKVAAVLGDFASTDPGALAEQMLAGDADGAGVRIEALRAQGFSLEQIYLGLLAPAASHLRHLWNGDLCGFADATLALWRLQQLLRHYSVEFRAETNRQQTERRVLLAPTPFEKHDLSYAMFYLVLMSEFFRRDGWEPWIEPDPNAREFAEAICRQWFDTVELLVSGDKQLDALASRIRMIRRESQNRSVGVIVYGQVFIDRPELVLLVGADLTATDARQGTIQAQHLLSRQTRP